MLRVELRVGINSTKGEMDAEELIAWKFSIWWMTWGGEQGSNGGYLLTHDMGDRSS